MNAEQLDRALTELQEESVNNGGSFRFQEFSLKGPKKLEDFLQNLSEEVKQTSLKIQALGDQISKRIDHWSLYEGPTPLRKENSTEYDSLKRNFVADLIQFLHSRELSHVYQVENLASELNAIIESGKDHLNEDFIFKTKHEYYILHLGFSS
ncbi:MAG: hypothetical protein AAFR87_34850 [Bacteroidota bacterium]